MNRLRLACLIGFLAVLFFGLGQRPAYADPLIFVAKLDTSGLVGNLNGPFSVAFVLTDGSGAGDSNNTVLLSGFAFGGGSAGSVSSFSGGTTGALSSGVSLTDSSFLNYLVSAFTPGSTLSFTIDMTLNVDGGGTPDQFSFSLLNGSGFNINTRDPTEANSLLTVNIDSASPMIQTFGSDLTPAPTATLVPEPATLWLVVTGLVMVLLKWQQKAIASSTDLTK
jgi:hypothetical protein